MSDTSGLMRGKRGLIFGIANNRSLAYGIAKACADAGASLALTYQGDALKKRVEPIAEELGAKVAGHCDVTDPSTIDAVFAQTDKVLGDLDFVVHAIAFSDKAQLDGRHVDTTADNFNMTLAISCYSLTAIAQRAEKRMPRGGAITTLSYYGAEKWMPHYNVMGVAKAALECSVRYLAADLGPQGVRVNAISAGPMRTLAGAVIGSARYVYRVSREASPLRRNVELTDVGGAGLYLLSDLSAGVTGTVHYVDAGYHAVGMPPQAGENGNAE
jgi:enoyl-[acyl-carrier protein] reductase I